MRGKVGQHSFFEIAVLGDVRRVASLLASLVELCVDTHIWVLNEASDAIFWR